MGHEILVITSTPGIETRTWDNRQSFELRRILNFKAFALKYLYQWFHLNRLLSKKCMDLLISQRWNVSGLVCEKARGKFAIPHYQFFHGNEIYDRHLSIGRWRRLYENAILNADINVCVSRFTERRLRENIGKPLRSRIIHSGVDIERFVPATDQKALKDALGFSGKYILLTLGRLVARKGQDQVIQALPVLTSKIPDLLYVIAGKGSYESSLRSLVTDLGLGKFVHFAGFIPEEQKINYYQMCDLYIMPSREIEEHGDIEGFGLTFLEANACGKPVIAGNSGGCAEAVQEEVNGLLIAPMDIEAIAEAILRLYDSVYYTELSGKALSYVRDQYRWDESARAVLECSTPRIISKRL
jgi:phosphatidylinositol alpha-1,6-mannosyltransferase